jgi:hypothetical protein
MLRRDFCKDRIAIVSTPNPLSRIRWLYHFTDSRNVPYIRDWGGVYSRAKLEEMGVEFHPGGNEWSLEADEMFGMHQYVHLCFRTNQPMEFIARQDGRIERTTWLYIDPTVLNLPGVMYSPGVSNRSGMVIHPIPEAVELIDFEVICTRTNWRDPAIKARLDQAEKCEILVPDHVPLEFFERYLPHD